MNAWESIFMQSPVNNGFYEEDELQQQNRELTLVIDFLHPFFFQERLKAIMDCLSRRTTCT
jgi:hypothetical protein